MKSKEMVQDMIDVFSGADGGEHFIRFRFLLESMEERANTGDESAQKVMAIVRQFHRFLMLAPKVK